VLVSGGGWGLGDVEGAARTGRRLGAAVVCLCGTNAGLRARLGRAFARDPLVRVEGFTDAMCAYLAAADVLVHSTAGLTMLEAQMCGTRAISYGWGVAHIRANNRAYERFGLAAVAGTPALLEVEMRRALETPRPPDRSFAALPHAADAVLELAAAAPAVA
jgi:UDP-N-acetylglucosamine:LPS N-acetylglucosamine transferase